MNLEKLNEKVNRRKNIQLSSWMGEVNKSDREKIGIFGVGWDVHNEGWGEKSEKGRIGGTWGNRMIEGKKGWIGEQGSTYLG